MFPETSILSYFADLDAPRVEKNRKHPLINVVTISILGVISGADAWVYGNAKIEWLSTFLDLKNGVPSTIHSGGCFADWKRINSKPDS